MSDRTKMTLVVGLGTNLIEASLFGALWFLFLSALPLIAAFDRNLTQGSPGILQQGLGFSLMVAIPVFLFWKCRRTLDFLRTQMCWALARHCHGRG